MQFSAMRIRTAEPEPKLPEPAEPEPAGICPGCGLPVAGEGYCCSDLAGWPTAVAEARVRWAKSALENDRLMKLRERALLGR